MYGISPAYRTGCGCSCGGARDEYKWDVGELQKSASWRTCSVGANVGLLWASASLVVAETRNVDESSYAKSPVVRSVTEDLGPPW